MFVSNNKLVCSSGYWVRKNARHMSINSHSKLSNKHVIICEGVRRTIIVTTDGFFKRRVIL